MTFPQTTNDHIRADSRLAPSQWETLLQSNAVSHWLGTCLESAWSSLAPSQWERLLRSNILSHWLGANLESALHKIVARLPCDADLWIICHLAGKKIGCFDENNTRIIYMKHGLMLGVIGDEKHQIRSSRWLNALCQNISYTWHCQLMGYAIAILLS